MKSILALILAFFIFPAASFAEFKASPDNGTVTIKAPAKQAKTVSASASTITATTMGRVEVKDLSPTQFEVSYDYGNNPGSYRFERCSDLRTGVFQPASAGMIAEATVVGTKVIWKVNKAKITTPTFNIRLTKL